MIDLFHEAAGGGPPLLLLHGIGARASVWKPVLPLLARERRVLALDLPGFGRSAKLSGGSSPAELAEAVTGWLDAQGLGEVHVAGNSMGGWIALELAARGRARSVTAVSPAGFWSRGELRASTFVLRAERLGSRALAPLVRPALRLAAVRRALFLASFERGERLTPAEAVDSFEGFRAALAFGPALRAMRREFAFARDGEVRCPLTFLWGARDRLLPPRQLERARKRFPGARCELLPGCGHAPFWDDPELVARELLRGSSG